MRRLVGAGVCCWWASSRIEQAGRADQHWWPPSGALLLLAVAVRKGHRISTRESAARNAPWQIVVFSLGMYLVVYGLRNAGLTGYLTSAYC
jgi:hypothetical protein